MVREGEVRLVDREHRPHGARARLEPRPAPDGWRSRRAWRSQRRNATLTQITYQRFVVRYLRLAGISGTLRGSGGELRAVYGLGMVRVPPRTPRQVRRGPTRLFATSEALWQAVAGRAAALVAAGRPVLVGTESVRQSEALAAALRSRGLDPVVLNARQDREESEIIAAAGQPGRLTVATSMAGRGAHIALAPEVLASGGLHVILCQLNASPRIDRQFLGRAGRQGQPGSCETLLALDFPLLQKWLPAPWQIWLRQVKFHRLFAGGSLRAVQALESWSRTQQRARLAQLARNEERDLNFSRWGSA